MTLCLVFAYCDHFFKYKSIYIDNIMSYAQLHIHIHMHINDILFMLLCSCDDVLALLSGINEMLMLLMCVLIGL